MCFRLHRLTNGTRQYRVRSHLDPLDRLAIMENLHDSRGKMHGLTYIPPPVRGIQRLSVNAVTGYRRIQGRMSRPCNNACQLLHQRLAQGIHVTAVVGNLDLELSHEMACTFQTMDQTIKGLLIPGQRHGLATVDCSNGHIPVLAGRQHFANLRLSEPTNGNHCSLARGTLLQMASCPGNANRIFQRKDAGSPCRGWLTGTVSDTDIRAYPVMIEPFRQRNLKREVRRLRELRLVHVMLAFGIEPALPQGNVQLLEHIEHFIQSMRENHISFVERPPHVMPLRSHACVDKDEIGAVMIIGFAIPYPCTFRLRSALVAE